jgi:predicted membrane channel-forming protein YqfA (hemolysin III family)
MRKDQPKQTPSQPVGAKHILGATARAIIFHTSGAAFVVASTMLFMRVSAPGTPWHTVARVAYGGTMLLWCLLPMLYRLVARKPARWFLRVFDFPDICLLVAGGYTLCTLI